MSLLSLHGVSIAFGHLPLLEQANLHVEPGDRACLIGRNGTGKSTLLKIIAGLQAPDEGEIRRPPGVRLGYLPQEPQLVETQSVFENVAAGLGALRQHLLDYHQTLHALQGPGGSDPDLLETLHRQQEALERENGWQAQQRIEQVLSRLELPPDVPVGQLSGGWKRRVALGAALVTSPDILLLDEPTNHLDTAMIQWLEETLAAYQGALLFVTHDRRFLENIANRIVELDRGRLTEFSGSYKNYLRRKQEFLQAEAEQQALFDKHLAEEERWIRRGIQARRTRNMGRVRNLLALREEYARRRSQPGKARIAIDAGEQSGKLVLEAEDVNFAYQGQALVKNFSLRVLRGDRIGLIGPNGVGKTTLLKLLLKQLEPQSGRIQHGSHVQVAYFDQTRALLNPESRVVDNVGEGRDTVTINGKSKHVMSYLQDFLFPPERARSPVKSLSGGERNRLLLARLFSQPTNVLVMDEPTNDLDIETLELLEELLAEFPGTLFLVSHDRAFLDNVVTSCLDFEGNGKIQEYVGGYADCLRQRKTKLADNAAKALASKTEHSKPQEKDKTATAQKLSYKDQRELDTLPARIEKLEQESAQVQQALTDTQLYREQPEKLKTLQQRLKELETELKTAYARWENLEAMRAG